VWRRRWIASGAASVGAPATAVGDASDLLHIHMNQCAAVPDLVDEHLDAFRWSLLYVGHATYVAGWHRRSQETAG
jgi:hypothetical protein